MSVHSVGELTSGTPIRRGSVKGGKARRPTIFGNGKPNGYQFRMFNYGSFPLYITYPSGVIEKLDPMERRVGMGRLDSPTDIPNGIILFVWEYVHKPEEMIPPVASVTEHARDWYRKSMANLTNVDYGYHSLNYEQEVEVADIASFPTGLYVPEANVVVSYEKRPFLHPFSRIKTEIGVLSPTEEFDVSNEVKVSMKFVDNSDKLTRKYVIVGDTIHTLTPMPCANLESGLWVGGLSKLLDRMTPGPVELVHYSVEDVKAGKTPFTLYDDYDDALIILKRQSDVKSMETVTKLSEEKKNLTAQLDEKKKEIAEIKAEQKRVADAEKELEAMRKRMETERAAIEAEAKANLDRQRKALEEQVDKKLNEQDRRLAMEEEKRKMDQQMFENRLKEAERKHQYDMDKMAKEAEVKSNQLNTEKLKSQIGLIVGVLGAVTTLATFITRNPVAGVKAGKAALSLFI